MPELCLETATAAACLPHLPARPPAARPPAIQQGLAETLCGSPLYMAPEILHFHK